MTRAEQTLRQHEKRLRTLAVLKAPEAIMVRAKARWRRADAAVGEERLRRTLFGGKA